METATHILFYGHTKPFGQFSNFYPAPFVVGGVKYNCSEQRFMKAKQELFDPTNKALAQEIISCTKPSTVKNLGRKIANFDEESWVRVRYKAMVDANLQKFSQNPELLQCLAATGTKILVEAAPKDSIWGAGSSAEKIAETGSFPGLNLLGVALMEVRAKLCETQAAQPQPSGPCRWAIYGRTGGSTGLEGAALAADIEDELKRQKDFCLSYAQQNRLDPVAGIWWYEDRCQATAPLQDAEKRPGLQALLASGATGIICADCTRLGDASVDPPGWLKSRGLAFCSASGH
jgi:ribA/ribD-fused uncharacterized protein